MLEEVYKKLKALDAECAKYVEDKNGLTYLSWANAIDLALSVCPDLTYEIVKFDGIPYRYDPLTGYIVYTTVTISGITREMWLPVMDNTNRIMLDHPYEIQTKYKTIAVEAATMFDINKAIMRCLTKNLGMFGLGITIYKGEDLPEVVESDKPADKPADKPTDKPANKPVEKPAPAPVAEKSADKKPVDPLKEAIKEVKATKTIADVQELCSKYRAQFGKDKAFVGAVLEAKDRIERGIVTK